MHCRIYSSQSPNKVLSDEQENQGTGKWSNLPKATQQVRADPARAQVFLTAGSGLNCDSTSHHEGTQALSSDAYN